VPHPTPDPQPRGERFSRAAAALQAAFRPQPLDPCSRSGGALIDVLYRLKQREGARD